MVVLVTVMNVSTPKMSFYAKNNHLSKKIIIFATTFFLTLVAQKITHFIMKACLAKGNHVFL